MLMQEHLGWLSYPVCSVYSGFGVESSVSEETSTQSLLGIFCGFGVNQVTWLMKDARRCLWSSVAEGSSALKLLGT